MAMEAARPVPSCYMLGWKVIATTGTRSGMPSVLRLEQGAAMTADEDIGCMPYILGNQIIRK